MTEQIAGYRKILGPIAVLILLAAAAYFAFSGGKPEQPESIMPTEGAAKVTGTIVCLPQKETGGPQTLECAFGVRDDLGRHFALKDTDPAYKNVSTAPMNRRAEVEGTFEPAGDSKYDIAGIIAVTKITELNP